MVVAKEQRRMQIIMVLIILLRIKIFLIVATIQTLHHRWKHNSLEPEVHIRDAVRSRGLTASRVYIKSCTGIIFSER
ncbi:hypothetical protein J6590_000093 [Homalodisca vitripennis]|nr:hypothetical protein J6590_000093 [Homalodisca vitripennis]